MTTRYESLHSHQLVRSDSVAESGEEEIGEWRDERTEEQGLRDSKSRRPSLLRRRETYYNVAIPRQGCIALEDDNQASRRPLSTKHTS